MKNFTLFSLKYKRFILRIIFLGLFCFFNVNSLYSQYAKDGNLTISALNTIVNSYTPVTLNVSPGATTIQVRDIAGDLGGLVAGDLILIYQAQGAIINTSNSVSYGSINNYNGAGTYEYAYVEGVTGNEISVCPLTFGYLISGFTQVVKVPQYNTLTINNGASVTATAWQDSGIYRLGGIVAINAVNVINNGSVNVSSIGFRGGVRENQTSGAGATVYSNYVTNSDLLSAEKGESIAGFGPEYDSQSGRYGRGAPANGGGGGNAHNAGGGGGANGNNGNVWFNGAGVMCNSCTGFSAWSLDPDYIANGNSRTSSSGGGRGGYTYGSNDENALSRAPGSSQWGGDYRDPVGGLGGRPLSANPLQTIFFGGGGGAGDGNNTASNDGGDGGGIILLDAGSVSGSGSFTANGQNALNTLPSHNDAPGGGGAGGTIIVESPSISNTLSLSTNGGSGGNQLITGSESEGPGGGGSGGFIAITNGTPITTINGGINGTSNSSSVTEFPANGATIGAAGQFISFAGDIVISCINANNNNFSGTPVNGVSGGTTASVFPIDRLNGTTFANSAVIASIFDNDGLIGLTINSAGVFTIPAGTSSGTYNVVYRICESLNPTNCDTAIAIIEVFSPICNISAISSSNNSICSDNGTPANSTDDFFTTDVTVTFTNAPVSGTLELTGDGTASVSVTGLTSPHTFIGVTMTADGSAIDVTATFSADAACTFNETNAGTAPVSCSFNPDSDGDGVPNTSDICPGNDDNADADGDGVPDGCDSDDDNDGIPDYMDNPCESAFTFNQTSEGWFSNNNNTGIPITNPAAHSTDATTGTPFCSINIYGASNASIAGLSPTGSNYVVDADDTGGNMWLRSPNYGGLNLSNSMGGIFQYDGYNYRVGFTGNPTWGNTATPTTMQFEGTDGTIVEATATINYTNWENGIWNTFTVPLLNANWNVITGTGNLSTVLASVQNIRIRSEFINGGNSGNCGDVEYYAIDNIVFTGPGACSNDTDGDGIPNDLDLDADNDGIYDVVEAGLGAYDTNGDGVIDTNDTGFIDANNDGIDDRIGVYTLPDTDSDGTPDYMDADSDNDGCSDADEAYDSLGTDVDGNGYYGTGNPPATNAINGTVIGASYTPGSVNNSTTSGIDTDGDGIADFCDLDDDNDGNPDSTDTNPLTPTAVNDMDTAIIGQPQIIQIIDNDDYYANNDPNSTGTITINLVAAGTNAAGTISFDPDTGELTYTPLTSEGNTTVTIVYEVCNDLAPFNPSPAPSGPEDVCTQATVTIDVIGDTDGDGVTDDVDPDINNPCDPVQSSGYTGYDSTNPIWQAADCDGDGVTNGVEANTDGTDPYDPCDYNSSSQVIANVDAAWNNADCDGDGVTNGDEIASGTNPQDPCDFNAVLVTLPTSTAWRLADCDGDGTSNGQEVIDGTNPLDPCDVNNQVVQTDPLNPGSPEQAAYDIWAAADCDGDGEDNGTETGNNTDPFNPCDYTVQTIPTNPNTPGTPAQNAYNVWAAADCDGDGEDNGTEATNGTNPFDSCDVSVATIPSPSSPNYGVWAAADCDGDGESNGTEATNGTNPYDPCDVTVAIIPVNPIAPGTPEQTAYDVWAAADCDGDGVTNGVEADSDGDGVNGNGPTDTDPFDPCDYDTNVQVIANVTATWNALDCDGDGVTNGDELADGTNPQDPCDLVVASQTVAPTQVWIDGDCDGDGVTNGQEVIDGTDPVDPCDYDSDSQDLTIISELWDALDCDGDGVTNGQEINDGTNPLDLCDFVLDSQTLLPSDEWNNTDCDGDGVTNGDEVSQGTDPLDLCDLILADQTLPPSDVWNNTDCDGDGVTNGDELTNGTDPFDLCDFVFASQTVTTSEEWDKTDCDGDGVINGQEIIDGTDPTDFCDYDFNNQDITIVSQTWLDADCDGDGISNGDEIADDNDNGIPDDREDNNGDPTAEDGLNVFDIMTPNGDGLNDVFVIRGIHNYPNNTVEIYNRWGVRVYETNGYGTGDNFFRGYSDGRVTVDRNEQLPVGTYYYIINYVNNDGITKRLAGPLYINRK